MEQESNSNLLDAELDKVPPLSDEVEQYLKNASNWTTAMSITGIGGATLILIGAVMVIFPVVREIAVYLLIFGFLNVTFVAKICQSRAEKYLKMSMETTLEELKDVMISINNALKEAIEKRKKAVADKLPQN
jgi:hypothetical protein